jgi:hypothetical protein
MITSQNYDLIISDIMGVRGFDLLALAVKPNFPMVNGFNNVDTYRGRI